MFYGYLGCLISVGHNISTLENNMQSIFTKFSVILAFLIIAGCAATQQISGSVANATLQSDVMRAIGTYESAMGGSDQPKLVSASSAGKTGSTFIEHWVVDSNGKKVTYQVKLIPSPQGGIDYGIVRLQ